MNKWDSRYAAADCAGEPVDVLIESRSLLEQFISQASRSLRSLDLACGLGANGLVLAEMGFDSCCWDNSAVALAKLQSFAEQKQLAINTEQRDVENLPPLSESFDLIVVSKFLYRPICAALVDALRPNGILLYQTFSLYKDGSVPTTGPQNKKFRLAEGELLELFSALEVLGYREMPIKIAGRELFESWLVGRKAI